MDQRIQDVAKTLVDYSIRVKKNEYILVEGGIESIPLIKEIYRLIIKKGAYPKVNIGFPGQNYIYYKNASDEQLKKFPEIAFNEIKKAQGYIGIASTRNTRELSNTDPKKIALRQKVTDPISHYIVNTRKKIRRCSTLFPTEAFAQEADMSLEEYEDFVFGAMLQDWGKLKKHMDRVKAVLDKASVIKIVGEDTDIKIGVKNRPFIVDAGEENFPGGEIFNAPLEFETEGRIHFTYPAIRAGREVEDIVLEFKKGKVVKATARKNEKFLKEMIKTDKGSQYLGELGIGFNPKVTRFTKDLLFDEKLGGTIHLALGMAYVECKGTNKSALHWDIVKDLRKNGKIIADDKVVQRNGKWLI